MNILFLLKLVSNIAFKYDTDIALNAPVNIASVTLLDGGKRKYGSSSVSIRLY